MVFLAILGPAEKCSPRSILEDFANALACSGRALEIVPRPNLVRYGHTLKRWTHHPKKSARKETKTYLLRGYRSLARLLELVDYSSVTSEVVLAANKNDGKTSAEVHHLRNPLDSGDAVRTE